MNAPAAQDQGRLPGRALGKRSLVFAALAGLAFSCEDPDHFLAEGQAGGPKGVIEGTVTYAGPLPCTENGHILGAAIMLVFDVRLLPPPEGLGTTAASLAVTPGDKLFASMKGRLTFNADGSRWCPAASEPPVTVSGTWAAAPLDAAVYQVRGFYDYDANFDPGFSISKLPTKGDIGGGAIDNAADVLVGKAPVYRRITIGEKAADGSLVMPDTGAHVGGVAVTLALPLPLDTPVFYPKEVLDETDAKNKDALVVTMPSDFQLDTFSVADANGTEKSFIRLKLGAGVPKDEVDAAAAAPFGLPVKTAAFVHTKQDVNGDGVIDASDHIPDSKQIPSLFPLSIFTKLNEVDAADKNDKKSHYSGVDSITNQGYPVVVMQGITIYKSLFSTAFFPANAPPEPEMIVGLRPAALCIDPTSADAPAVLVVSRETDKKGHKILDDEKGVAAALSAQFGRPVSIAYGCLPEGTYALNLIYGTGQAWTVPNEAGVCTGRELEKDAATCCAQQGDATQQQQTCGASAPTRARLDSQRGKLIVGPPTEPAYCEKNPTPGVCTYIPAIPKL
ncbi:MAG: hypothetical protein U0359_37250 [Byssovorax sp.]